MSDLDSVEFGSAGFYDVLVTEATRIPLEDETGDAQSPKLPKALLDWLGRLRLLYGVPFNYLVPNEKLLPKESIRFFYIDRNWTDRLVEGAMSVGKTTTRDYAHHHQVHDVVLSDLDAQETCVRLDLRGESYNWSPAGGIDLTGMLMRSRIVSGWPGLEVKAYEPVDKPLTLLRMDRPAPDILFCLFLGIPTRVDIEEPREGIQFGVDKESTAWPSGFELKLRYISGPSAGEQVEADGETVAVTVPVRRSHRRVIHVKELAGPLNLPVALANAGVEDPLYHTESSGTPDAPSISPASLGVQMLQFPYRQRFEGAGSAPPDVDETTWWTQMTPYAAASFVTATMVAALSSVEMDMMTD